jgi:hypothetical protein
MEPTELLDLWQQVHQQLDTRLQSQFLSRPELAELTALPNAALLAAIGRAKKLDQILLVAKSETWWHRGDPCDEDNLPWCARCKPSPYPSVVTITRGWSSTFHRDPTCVWLHKGQARVTQRGGTAASVDSVALQVALGQGRFACLACFPISR